MTAPQTARCRVNWPATDQVVVQLPEVINVVTEEIDEVEEVEDADLTEIAKETTMRGLLIFLNDGHRDINQRYICKVTDIKVQTEYLETVAMA